GKCFGCVTVLQLSVEYSGHRTRCQELPESQPDPRCCPDTDPCSDHLANESFMPGNGRVFSAGSRRETFMRPNGWRWLVWPGHHGISGGAPSGATGVRCSYPALGRSLGRSGTGLALFRGWSGAGRWLHGREQVREGVERGRDVCLRPEAVV